MTFTTANPIPQGRAREDEIPVTTGERILPDSDAAPADPPNRSFQNQAQDPDGFLWHTWPSADQLESGYPSQRSHELVTRISLEWAGEMDAQGAGKRNAVTPTQAVQYGDVEYITRGPRELK